MRLKGVFVCVCCATVLGAANGARAQCPDSLLWQWPRAESLLPTDGHIMVKGFGGLGRQVAGLAHHRPSLLGDDGDLVPLFVLSVNELGDPGDELGVPVTEATLIPTRPLRPANHYRLWFRDLDPRRGTAWALLVWTTASGPMAFLPEQVTKRPDAPPDCMGGAMADGLQPADVEYLHLPAGTASPWLIGYRLFAVIVFHCGVAVLAAAWIHARGRRAREAR